MALGGRDLLDHLFCYQRGFSLLSTPPNSEYRRAVLRENARAAGFAVLSAPGSSCAVGEQTSRRHWCGRPLRGVPARDDHRNKLRLRRYGGPRRHRRCRLFVVERNLANATGFCCRGLRSPVPIPVDPARGEKRERYWRSSVRSSGKNGSSSRSKILAARL